MPRKPAAPALVEPTDLARILGADHADPFGVLGMHPLPDNQGLVVRAFLPGARRVGVVDRASGGEPYPAVRLHPDGFYAATIPNRQDLFPYELEVEDGAGTVGRHRDPYSFWPRLSPYDQYLFNEGTHFQLHRHLGAHRAEIDGVWGTQFSVWAPNARRVSVVGDFNQWDGRVHSMRSLGASGIWEIFLPGVELGAVYKYELRAASGEVLLKADPCGLRMETPPRSGSVVHGLDRYAWTDQEWMANRPQRDWLRGPMAIYEVHPGSWRTVPEEGDRALTYRELAHQLVAYVLEQGFTHVELLPVAEHPFAGSWGYQVIGYFAPTSRHGLPEDFAYFVDYCHRHGVGVIVDWVPAHFPRDGHGLATFDGTCLYEHQDPRRGAHPDWGTLVFNFGRHEVCSFLLANALFWFEQYHVDGIRVDAVASMLYLDYSRPEGQWLANPYGGRENLEAIHFLKQLNTEIYARHPGAMTIAEESTAWPAVSRPTYAGGLGFGFKWNMGWMNDVLRYFTKDPVYRKYCHSDLTFGMLYAYHENFVLPLSHDEVVHGKGSLLDKMPGDGWQKFANLRLLFGFMYGHPGKKLLFMGGEFGHGREWSHERSLDWHLLELEPHQGVQRWVRDLNRLYHRHPALHRTDAVPGGFAWVDCQDVENSVIAFLRQDPDGGSWLLFVGNFTPVPRPGYRVGVPHDGYCREVLNSDAAGYGGSNLGNRGGAWAEPRAWHGHPWSVELHLPPLAMLVLEPAAAPA